MSSSQSEAGNAGKDIADTVKKGLTGIHGVGEAIRGNMLSAVNGFSNDKAGQTKNDKITQNGMDEIQDGQYRGHTESQPRF